MTSDVRQTLMRVVRKSKSDSLHVFTDDGKPYTPNRVSVAFGRACKATGIQDLRYHDLRHDFSTAIINSGQVSLYQLQHQLGHSDGRMTQRYAHLLPENQNVVDKIDGTGTTTILRQSQKKELPKIGNSLK